MRSVIEHERVTGWPLVFAWIVIYGASWAIAFGIYSLASRVFAS